MSSKPDTALQLDAAVLGQLMTAEGMIQVLPDNRHIADFSAPAIKKVPGVSEVGLCLEGEPHNLSSDYAEACYECKTTNGSDASEHTAACILQDKPNTKVIRLQTASSLWGFAVLALSDALAFAAYDPFVRNFLNHIALTVENRRQKNELLEANQTLSSHRDHLEEQVQIRTAELRESEERYRRIVETANEGIWQMDGEFKTTYVNQVMADMLGYTPEEMLGRPVDSFMFKEDSDEHEANMLKRSKGEDQIYECRFQHKDDSEVWAIVSAKAIKHEDGSFAGSFAMFTDITHRKITEKALEASETKFRNTFDHAPILITISILKDGTYVDVNDMFCEVTGYTKGEAIGKTSIELGWVSKEDRALLVKDLAAKGRVSDKQLNLRAKDGREITCLYHGEVFHLAGEQYLISAATDMTQYLAQEQKYSQILNTAIDGFWVVDSQGNILEVNPAGSEMLGYTKEELLSLKIPDIDANESPEDTQAHIAEIMQSGKGRFETKHMRKDGSLIDVEVSASHLPIWEGHFVVFVRDITARKQAEQAVREAEERFRLAFFTSPDSININRLNDGMYVEVNQGFLDIMGYTRDEVIGKTSLELNVWANPKDREELVRGLTEKGSYSNLEAQFQRKDGSVTTGLMSASVIPLAGEPHIISITRDIGPMRQAEQEQARLKDQLQQAQKMDALGTLASGIAHDFNNILAAIMGYSELAQDELPEEHPVAHDIVEITKATTKAKQLVRQILTFSRKQEANQLPTSLNNSVQSAYSMLERTIPRMVDLHLDLGKQLPVVKVDPQQIEQVIINLVTNSLGAMEDNGQITIRTKTVKIGPQYCDACGRDFFGDFVMLSVKDTGAGIDPEIKGKIFEPFFTTKGVGKGTGLGLSTIFGIVASHGGHIKCDSQVGSGTDFKIYLPLIEQQKLDRKPDGNDLEQIKPGSGTILVVDDEPAVRDIASKLLSRNGYQVVTAASGEEALEVYREKQQDIDAVVMDLGMPGMGGKACLKELRQVDPHVKVVIASGYIQYELTDELKELGAWGMVAKPYRKADLLNSLWEMVNE